MRKKIFGLIALLILGGGVFLWWRGGQELARERLATEQAAQKQAAEMRAFQTRLEQNLRAVSTSTLETITSAIATKGAPLQSLTPADLAKRQYTMLDLKIVSNETAATRSAYQAGIKKILTGYTRDLTGDETASMLAYLDSRSTTTLKVITDSDENLKRTTAALAKLSVPASASFLHLQLLNSLASLRQIIYNMSQVASEPLLAAESADHRQQSYLAVISAIGLLSRYLANPIVPPSL